MLARSDPATRFTGGHTRVHSQYSYETDRVTCQTSSFWTENTIRGKLRLVDHSGTCDTDYRWPHPGSFPLYLWNRSCDMSNFIILDEEPNKRKDMYGGPLENLRYGLSVVTSGAMANIAMKQIVRHVKIQQFERRTQLEERFVWWTTWEPAIRFTGGHKRKQS